MQITDCKRILLKVSGEALMGAKNFGHDVAVLNSIAEDISTVQSIGVQICIVVGGGNIFRGENASSLQMERVAADHMGMLGTVINALALQNSLEKHGIDTRVQSAIPIPSVCEPFIKRRAKRHIEKNRVVIFAAGIGNPFFTTDSAAALRAIEMSCDYLLKGSTINGVYDKDPEIYPDAVKYEQVTYTEVLRDNLKVMDMAAIALARENNLPIKVFSIKEQGNLVKILQNQGEFTLIKGV